LLHNFAKISQNYGYIMLITKHKKTNNEWHAYNESFP
jgi:hypothetical protein